MTFKELLAGIYGENCATVELNNKAIIALADELDRRAAGNQVIAGAGDQYRRFRNYAVKSGDD